MIDTNPVVAAIAEAAAAYSRGEVASVVIDMDALKPMDELDEAALTEFFRQNPAE